MTGFLAHIDEIFVMAIDNFGTVVIVTYIQHYQKEIVMSREQRIVDTETGEILSSRKIKPNANFVQFYFSFSCLKKMDQENALIVSTRNFVRIFWNFKRTIIRQS